MCRCNGPHSCPAHATDICLYVPFCIAFVVLGSVQVVSGIFYFISIPVIKLLINIAIGCWVILTGIGTGMVACICSPAPRKHEFLLYCTVSVLVLNVLNVLYLEFGQLRHLFDKHLHERFGRDFELLDAPARLITTGTAVLLVCVAFAEAQLNFYLLHRCQRAQQRRRSTERKTRQLYAGNDQSADLEYVIPKKADLHHQTSVTSDPRIDTKSVQVHNKSWVFEATGDEDDDANFDESSVSLCSSVSPSHSGPPNGGGGAGSHQQQPHHQMLAQPAQTAVVNAAGHQHQRQRRISRVSDAASERFAMQMTSFSRCATPSPVPRSGTQSPAHGAGLFSPYSDYLDPTAVVKPTPTASSFGVHKQHHVAADGGASSSTTTITNNRLTVDFLAAATAKLKPVTGAHPSQLPHVHDTSNATSTDPTSMTTQADDSPYASLLAELEHSLHEKMASSFSPDNTSLSTSDNKFSSKSASSSKDLEFSKELEAALQLIQELETPSEGPYLGDAQLLHHHQIAAIAGGAGGADAVPSTSQLGRSDSEKTLSAAVSLPSPEAGPLVDTSSTPTDGVSMAPTQLSASASMHRLVIDVRAATTTPTSPTAVELTIAGTPTTTATVTPAHSTNGKHVFSVFCNDRNGGGGGSQSTSGYSSPSTSSHMTAHSVRDSCEPTPGDQRVLLNSFGAANIIHIQATQHGGQQSSNRYVPGYYQSQYQQPRTPAAVASNGLTPTMFINTLNPAPNSIEHQRRSSSTSSSSSEYRNPVAMTASPASRSTSSTLAHDAGAASPASKSFLLFKKRSKLMPQPDFQSRIFKSECLAYLTESELLQRHQLNRNVIRNIELNVARRVKGCQPK